MTKFYVLDRALQTAPATLNATWFGLIYLLFTTAPFQAN
jgi:hypothetical protein